MFHLSSHWYTAYEMTNVPSKEDILGTKTPPRGLDLEANLESLASRANCVNEHVAIVFTSLNNKQRMVAEGGVSQRYSTDSPTASDTPSLPPQETKLQNDNILTLWPRVKSTSALMILGIEYKELT